MEKKAKIDYLTNLYNNQKFSIHGIVTGSKSITTRRGQPMGFVTAETYNGTIDIVVFPSQWSRFHKRFTNGKILKFFIKYEMSLEDESFILEDLRNAKQVTKTSNILDDIIQKQL